ncbi:pyrimidine dimer DNA glycosylase/endonuclease V [Actinomyces sp. ZJ308]|uniref:pyrimidine dimer DNA glycosylase/endonuclease V n=1 Tax=Actinomyces sp. ZJ308 TaxID=2708342 RepID=UPI001AB0573E|nr:pyrimidine dimer DNA glycosylase/endonuclease V [Actinomyces sp. ZJ308]
MRMWSLHPSHLDRAGLVACWRESLLAQAVLAGRTRGYRNHPQLERFRGVSAPTTPAAAVGAYLWGLREEAVRRGYRFDASRIDVPEAGCSGVVLTVTEGQMDLERRHLEAKLAVRAPDLLPLPDRLKAHPILRVIPGEIEPWERALTP